MTTIRTLLTGLAALGLSALLTSAPARADHDGWHHATALTGTPKYAEGFKHFDYVNPDAPKGGRVRMASQGGFDTFNPILPRGTPAAGLGYVFETLMKGAFDEADISAEYGLLADAVKYPADFSRVTYRLNPNAKWHDGQPVTPEDVVWSFDKTVELNPQQRFYYSHVVKAEKTGEREVTFTFDQAGNRELPHIVGQMMVLPKHWWEGTDAQGRKRDIAAGTLEPPVGSGAYRVKSFEAGRQITYERVPDWWGKDLPVNIGYHNFDEIRFDEYRDITVLLEAFKGDQYDFRFENSAKNWATGYDFPAARDGRVILETFPDKASGQMQAFVMNLRLAKFRDARVRRALNLAWDFESLKDTIFFGQYKRIDSYFAGTDLAASGLPSPAELAILDPLKGQIPEAVFTQPYKNPVSDSPQALRENLREAVRLLQEAGYKRQGNRIIDPATGQPFTIELIDNDGSLERYVLPWRQNLEKIGITLTLRVIDTSQLIERLRNFDFEMTVTGWGQSLSPGNEQKDFWGSEAADRPGSRNYAGIKDPAVDRLIDAVIFAKDRDQLIAATKALDRVLLHSDFVIPQFYIDVTRTARWNRFGHPAVITPYTPGFPDVWWWDAEKAKKTGGKV